MNTFSATAAVLFLWIPFLTTCGPFYKGGYREIPDSLAELRAIAADNLYRIDRLLPYKSSTKLLEVGPWIEAFSCNAKDAAF